MSTDGREWIERLPGELDGQRAILTRLVDWCERDERVRWLAVGCSVGRGAADRLSDLDLGMGVRVAGEDFDATVTDVRRVVDGLADLVESYQHKLPELRSVHERIFAQYASRCQVDLVVLPDENPIRAPRDFVLLYDADEHAVAQSEVREVTPTQVREWAFWGWASLADLGKYLRRGSPWEALDRLHRARGELWRLLAVASGVPNPQYGITSLLDFAPGAVPEYMTGTVSDLDPARLLAAAKDLAGRLTDVGALLEPDLRAALPTAMASYITADLAAIQRCGRAKT